ncbi:MAG: acyl carrier protein [Phycisphaerae bacterium]|jgi:acyl carrier protein
MAATADIQETVKGFLLKEFLPGEDPAQLQADTPLITSGILDSIATLKLVSFLEGHFNIQLEAHEAGVDHLNTLADITSLVQSKQG